MIKLNTVNPHAFWLILLGICFFVPFLGNAHLFDWDEINFAECSREMLLTNNFGQVQLNFQPFWEKPPLFFWLQAASMQLFGVGEFAARFPNVICGILTMLTVYFIGNNYRTENYGWWWALAFLGSILPHLYFRSGIIDPFFNLFIFLAIYGFYRSEQYFWAVALSGIFCGLAILTKGPVALLITTLTMLVIAVVEHEFLIFVKKYFVFLLVTLLTTFCWVGIEIYNNGTWFIKEFVIYQVRLFRTQDAGHAGFFGYHFIVLLIGCFPISFLALRGVTSGPKDRLSLYMLVLFWVVLLLFSVVKTKIVHYSSLCYFPVTFFAAQMITKWQNGIYPPAYLTKAVVSTGTLIGLLVVVVPYLGQHIHLLAPLFEKDAFAKANLQADVHWQGYEAMAGILMVAVMMLYFVLYRKKKIALATKSLLLGVALFVFTTLTLYINKIEGYAQAAAIEFYKQRAEEDCIIETFGFKSYAQLFYAQKRDNNYPNTQLSELVRVPNLNKPLYVVAKINSAETVRKSFPTLKLLYSKNGFLFYIHSPNL